MNVDNEVYKLFKIRFVFTGKIDYFVSVRSATECVAAHKQTTEQVFSFLSA